MKITKVIPLTYPETNDPEPRTTIVSSLVSIKLKNGDTRSMVFDHLYGERPSIDRIFEYILDYVVPENDLNVIR